MKYTRLFSDSDGESHFEDVDVAFTPMEFAPPAPPLDLSVTEPAEHYTFMRAAAGWYSDWHRAPYRQVHFYLAGEVEAESSDGEIRRFGVGDVILVEDVLGKGHRSRALGSEDALIAVVKLPDSE